MGSGRRNVSDMNIQGKTSGLVVVGVAAMFLAGCSSGSAAQGSPTLAASFGNGHTAKVVAASANTSHQTGWQWAISYMNGQCTTQDRCAAAAVHAQHVLKTKYDDGAGTQYKAAVQGLSASAKSQYLGALQRTEIAVMTCEQQHPDISSKAFNKCMAPIATVPIPTAP